MAQDEILTSDKPPVIVEPTAPIPPGTLPPLIPKKPNPMMGVLKIAGVVVGLVLVLGLVFGGRGNRNQSASPTPSPTPTVDLARYEEDPDNDKIPSFVELKAGLNPEESEIEACFANRCNAPSIQEVSRRPRNVMILLDSSGSMAEKVGGATKMESAKLAIREYLKKADELPMTQVGLVIYGHEGSNKQEDKEKSCASAKVVTELGELSGASVETALTNVAPVGWTPIGLALSTAKENFVSDKEEKEAAGVEEAINEVVVISDGVETCDTNPVEVAKQLAESPEKITVHVIGFAVDTGESGELRKIAEAGKGTYATAPSIEELKVAMDLQWENYVRKTREAACDREGAKAYYACIDRAVQLVRSWVSAELSRDPRALKYEEKLKIDRLRWVVPSYMRGRLESGETGADYLPPSQQ